ncbi:hypothetical protein ACF0H5_014153 [Mactra antiquata]
MGSGSSSQPKETQSAPATARTTPKQQAPRRNRQFEEVQIANQGANTPRSRQQPQRQQGATPRGQDPGASGSTSERTSRQQPQSNRQGAAANGRKCRKIKKIVELKSFSRLYDDYIVLLQGIVCYEAYNVLLNFRARRDEIDSCLQVLIMILI